MSVGRTERHFKNGLPKQFTGWMKLRRIYIRGDGYEVGAPNVYWGVGLPLWCYSAEYQDENGEAKDIIGYLRASDRENAKQVIWANYNRLVSISRSRGTNGLGYENAKFYR